MKQLFFASILAMTFGITGSAQENLFCPSIKVVVPDRKYLPGEPMPFSVSLNNEAKNLQLEYKWEVSNGTIEIGQNTSAIIITTAGLDGIAITASVEIKGLPRGCANKFSGSGVLEERPGCRLPSEEHEGKPSIRELDDLAKHLWNYESTKAFIVFRFKSIKERNNIDETLRYLTKQRGIAKERVIFAIHSKLSDSRFNLYVVPSGISFPGCDGCEIIKGEDFEFREAIKSKTKNRK